MAEEIKQVKKTCILAKVSAFCLAGVPITMFLFDSGIGDMVLWMIPASLILSLLLAIVSLLRIKSKPEQLCGAIFAKVAIVGALCGGVSCLGIAGLFYWMISIRMSEETPKGIATSIKIYASDYDDTISDGSNWCDVLIEEVDGDPRSFIGWKSGAVYGESSFALNKNIVGKKLTELPKDMVLIFETSLGIESGKRKNRLRERESFKKYPLIGELFTGDELVYLNRWNQVGGPEDLTFDYHRGKGCYVCFVYGNVKFIKPEDIGNLRWTAEGGNPNSLEATPQ